MEKINHAQTQISTNPLEITSSSDNRTLNQKNTPNIYDLTTQLSYAQLSYRKSLEIQYATKQFKDNEFPHNNQTAGVNNNQTIVWVKLRNLNKNQHLFNLRQVPSIKSMKIKTESISNSLYYLQSIATDIFYQICKYHTDNRGAFKYSLMNKGLIKTQYIDEYVPTKNGLGLYTKPQNKEIFGCLIQKAIAKTYKGYNNISKYTSEITEILTHFPRQQIKICRNYSHQYYLQLLKQNLGKNNIIFFRTINNKKVKQQGFAQNQEYLIINTAENLLHQHYFQILQPLSNKSSTNVSMYNDSDHFTKSQSSIEMPVEKILKISDELIILHNSKNDMKNWSQNFYDVQCAIFYEINIQKQTQLTIYIYLQNRYCRSTLILAEKTHQNFKFIKGSMKQFNCTNFLSIKLNRGKYILYLNIQDQQHQFRNYYYLLYTFNHPIGFTKSIESKYLNFLSSLFSYHAHNNNPQNTTIIRSLPLQYISLKMLYDQTGYAYINVYVGAGSPYKIHIQLNSIQFKKQGFELMKPFNNMEYINLDIGEDENLLLLFKMKLKQRNEKILFPPKYIKIYEIL